jgi:tRNA pseudouridine38-40 synthase
MVRNIAGTLMTVGTEKQPVNWVETLLAAKNRALAAATAKPDGLYLMEVTYPAHFDLPASERSLF